MSLWLNSDDFTDGDKLNDMHALSKDFGFGCDGGNLSPHLSWGGDCSEGAKGWAITCFDPDAPTGCGFWHWLVLNIPPQVRTLERGAGNTASGLLPKGAVQMRTDFGATGYGGPCPPPGSSIHRYVFTVHALSVSELPVPKDATAALVSANVTWNSLAKAELIAVYRR